MPHEHWRSCKDWKDEGLPLTTTSDEAAKLFDAALTQCISFRELDSCGGLLKTFENLAKADPEFVLGRVLVQTISLIWSNISPDNPTIKKELDLTLDLAAKQKHLTPREKSYVEAFRHLYEGYHSKVRDVLEQILKDHPTDMAAYKLLYDSSVNNADKPRLKGFAERTWKSNLPLYEYLFGYKAFALCETGDYENSTVFAKKGLELIPTDIWSTHCLAHDYEMTGQYIEGQKFLENTVKFWEPSNILTRHVHWHNALFSIEKGDYQRALDIFDEKVVHGIADNFNTLDLCDASALLCRLQFQGIDVRERYDLIYKRCLSHVNDHQFSFADLHNLMAVLGSGHRSEGEKFVQELKELTEKNPEHPRDYLCVSAEVGVPLSEALLAYGQGHFDEAVDWMKPVENDIVKVGGSDAQRDVFSQLLLNAAINSTDPDHQQYAEDLLKKRKHKKQDSPLTDRLMEKFLKLQQGRK